MSLVALVVHLAGGYWRVRQRAVATRNRWTRRPWRWLHDRYLAGLGSYIGLGARFDGPPTFPHGPLGVFVSNKAHVGRDCVIFHQVTIGSNNLADSDGRGAPTIGDGCLLGAGAKVIGAVVVGANVRVGANCVVVKDVPAHAVVVAQPARVIQKDALDNRFVPVDL